MKKLIVFILLLLIIVVGIIYFTYSKEFLTILDEKKVYNVENVQETEISTLNEYAFFNGGIITYNNQKVTFLDYKNKINWINEDREFSEEVFITNNYIYRIMENKIQGLDKSNQKFLIPEIQGDVVNVSRENDKTYIVLKGSGSKDILYIMDNNNEMVVDNKLFDNKIIGVSISDKSEAYALVTLKFENNIIVNNVYFNLIDDVELWNTIIENEIIVGVKVVNNNVVLIGTKNVYYFNTNGKLMWKNGIYNKISDYLINKDNNKIYILFEKENETELISYNIEGKVTSINKLPENIRKLKVYGDKIFVYNENSIYLVHGTKVDKIFQANEGGISDFIVEDNSISILFKDKLVTGKIR